MLVENIMKKIVLFQAEVISFGADKVKEVADEFVKKGVLHDDDARKFISEVKDKIQNKEQELQGKAEKMAGLFKGMLQEVGIPIKCESEKIDNKIIELEKQLEELKAKKESIKKDSHKEDF